MFSPGRISKETLIKQFILRNTSFLFLAVFLIVISNFLNLFLPLTVGWFYEIVFGDHGTKSSLLDLIPFDIKDRSSFFLFFGAILVFKTILAFCEKYSIGVLSERFSRDLREMAFQAQLNHTFNSHQLRPVGKYLLRYSGDLIAIQSLMSKGILVFFGDTCYLFLVLSVLFYINIQLAIPVVLLFSLSALVFFFLGNKLREAALNRRTQRSLNLGFVSSRMHSFYTIKSFNRESPEQKSFLNRSAKLYKLSIDYTTISSLAKVLPSFFFFCILGTVLYEITAINSSSPFSKGDVFAFVLLLLYMQTVLKRLLKVNMVWQVGTISLHKLITLMNLPAESRPEEKATTAFSGAIAFNKVCFAYPDRQPIFKDLSFQIIPNTISLIKGDQGFGKSTLLKLIQNIYLPQNGEISFDGIPSSTFSPFEIRREITLVSDEAPLLGATIFKAVSYTVSENKKEKVLKMLKQLDIQLPCSEEEILQFKLNDGGKNISAGQRIKLQFARAFLTRKRIILIDNVFGNLDEKSLEIIGLFLNTLRKKRTILLVDQTKIPTLIIDQTIQL